MTMIKGITYYIENSNYIAVPKKRGFIYGGGHWCVLQVVRPLEACGRSSRDREVPDVIRVGYFG